ncbi:hypothetical protein AB1Y20_015663 [Prymnesium parvum]|uniref:Gfo/Idh/MocA-like oxidoreductase N-terminal domain-containing protein n=1 Tax=Prymnesium parvum TaxID=97485 RepID=A0AB34K3N3_PRYPA
MSETFLAEAGSRSAAIEAFRPSPSFRLRVGIVGCGQVSEHHMRAMAPLIWRGRVVISALIDPNAERRRALFSLIASEVSHPPRPIEASDLSDILEAVDECLDAVLIAVPHDLHESVAASALRAGVHVLLEKPLAPTLAACDRLASVVDESVDNGLLVVSEQSAHWPEVTACVQLIARGAIGRVVSVQADYFESMAATVFGGADPFNLGWRRSRARAGGGVVIDGGLHWIRPLRLLLGAEPEEVVAVTSNAFPELEMEGETLAHAILRTHDDRLATFRAAVSGRGAVAHTAAPFLRVTGQVGELVISGTGLLPGGGGLRLFAPHLPSEGEEQLAPSERRGFCAAFEGMWAEFVHIVETGDRAAAHANVRAARTDVAIALAMYDSARQRSWVRLGCSGEKKAEGGRLVRSAWRVASVMGVVAVAATASVLLFSPRSTSCISAHLHKASDLLNGRMKRGR